MIMEWEGYLHDVAKSNATKKNYAKDQAQAHVAPDFGLLCTVWVYFFMHWAFGSGYAGSYIACAARLAGKIKRCP